MKIILDPGHGMSNKKAGQYDAGAVSNGVEEATVAMDWVNQLKIPLVHAGHSVVRTRINRAEDVPVSSRAGIAKHYDGEIMLSVHCNAANGTASGAECFYRGDANREKAAAISKACAEALGIKDRGAKTEASSQHSRLAVMSFQPCFLLEIGFIDNAKDRAAMLDVDVRAKACEAIAKELTK